MCDLVGEDYVGRQFYLGLYAHHYLDQLPWRGEPFDCTVCLIKEAIEHDELVELSHALAATNTDWIQVAGKNSKALHDAVDEASVAIGRQSAVGDGQPMTSWHEDATTPQEMSEVAALCFGGQDRVLVLVVGKERDAIDIQAALKSRLTRGCS